MVPEADLLQHLVEGLSVGLQEALERNDAGSSRLEVFFAGMDCFEADPELWKELLQHWYAYDPDISAAFRQRVEQTSQRIREQYEKLKRAAQEAQDG